MPNGSYIREDQYIKVLPKMGVFFFLIRRKIYSELVGTIVRTNKSIFRCFVDILIRNILK